MAPAWPCWFQPLLEGLAQSWLQQMAFADPPALASAAKSSGQLVERATIQGTAGHRMTVTFPPSAISEESTFKPVKRFNPQPVFQPTSEWRVNTEWSQARMQGGWEKQTAREVWGALGETEARNPSRNGQSLSTCAFQPFLNGFPPQLLSSL